ncbi:thymopoietin isoform X1 [Tachyglossus aculeatus]|uniref:thymopoietin isoform X1 n=1 Tax=Tachyglossus aculeatus TaxID=9261 RepID=UPI0018F6E370|nr:thymopoietin isoform X1 [Tachyglossus aculeatus]
MPDFLEDPSVLTKDKLKSELIANSVALPAGEQRKDVYVQLYLQHLTARNRPPPAAINNNNNSSRPPDFSSDEEREPTPVLAAAGRSRATAGRKATKKTDKPRPEEKDDLDVTDLTNEDLLEQLVKYGVNPGPIVGTTRKLYEKKLLKLREQGPVSRSSTPLPTVPSAAENTRQNGNDDSDQYSDNEEGKKKKEPKKVKSTRDSVPISELSAPPSGGFFQSVSFPAVSSRPPLGWTELQTSSQAGESVHTSKRDPPREPLSSASLPGTGHVEELGHGRDFFSFSKFSHDRFMGKNLLSTQHDLASLLVSAAAKTSCSPTLGTKPTPPSFTKQKEHVFGREMGGLQSAPNVRSSSSDHPIVAKEWTGPNEPESSQIISPPLAQAIKEYVDYLLKQGGADSLPGTSRHKITVDPTAYPKNPELICSPQKSPKLSERPTEEGGLADVCAFQDSLVCERDVPSAFAKNIISQSLNALGIESAKALQNETFGSSVLSFPLHESILKVIHQEWNQIDRPFPSMSHKYPVSSKEAAQLFSVPKVDSEVLELTSEAARPADTRTTVTDSCDKDVELAFCRAYEAAASTLQIATHSAFVARAMQADIRHVAQLLSSDPSQVPEALGILSKTYDAGSFLCDAAFDEIQMAACAMGSSTIGRRHLWLKGCDINSASKKKLAVLPFRGGTLFGGEIGKVIKRRGNRK